MELLQGIRCHWGENKNMHNCNLRSGCPYHRAADAVVSVRELCES